MANDNSEHPRTADRTCIPEAQRAHLRRYATWQDFHSGVRRRSGSLLEGLPRYPDCVLVAGCQRSGTTMLTRLIAAAPRGAAGHRHDYSPTYYAAFLIDPDGNNVEAVCA